MGAFSLLFLTPDALVAARDPWGFRPLVLGRLDGATIVARRPAPSTSSTPSTCATSSRARCSSSTRTACARSSPSRPEPTAHCIFEHVYFARPDSLVFGRTVLDSRLRARPPARAGGARPRPTSSCPVPDSGMGAALGYARESGLPFEWGLIRNHYVGRTFIEPRQAIRSFGVKIKLNPVRQVLEGRRVVLIDDSIVRGTTSRKIVHMVREAGAREVHMRISSPPTIGPCYYGIDTPLKSELIASSHSVEEIRRFIEADSLAYLSHEGLLAAVADDAEAPALHGLLLGPLPGGGDGARRVAAPPLREGAGLSPRGHAAPPRRRPRHARPPPRGRRPRRLGHLRHAHRAAARLGGGDPHRGRPGLRARAGAPRRPRLRAPRRPRPRASSTSTTRTARATRS